MKITKKQLRRVIKEERQKLFKEYEQYVDEDGNIWDDEGNVTRRGAAFGRQYGGGTYGTNAPWSGGRSRSSYSSKRKTSYVGADANADQIAAVEKAIASKPNKFLSSVLTQLQKGRGLSSKQKSIVKKILSKSSAEDAALFEGYKMKITKRQLRKIILEEKARLLNEMTPADAGFEAARMDDKVAGTIQLLQTVHINLSEIAGGYAVDEELYDDLNMQMALLEDAIHSLGGVV